MVLKSKLKIADVADGLINKIPDYKDTIDQVSDYLILFEITFKQALVTLDFDNIEIIKTSDYNFISVIRCFFLLYK